MADKSRAEYFRERRKNMKQLVFMVDREKAEQLDQKLAKKGIGRTEWFREKLDEELYHGIKRCFKNGKITKKNRNSPPPSKSHGLFLKHHSRRSGKSMIPHLQGKYKEDTMAGR